MGSFNQNGGNLRKDGRKEEKEGEREGGGGEGGSGAGPPVAKTFESVRCHVELDVDSLPRVVVHKSQFFN